MVATGARPKASVILYKVPLIVVAVLCLHAPTVAQSEGTAQNSPAPLAARGASLGT